MNIDWTIHVSDVALFLGMLLAFLKMFVSTRDTMRDLVKAVGQAEPPSGLVGDVREVTKQVNDHHEWLIRYGLDRRTVADRRQAEEEDAARKRAGH